jgi:hypothetical protein
MFVIGVDSLADVQDFLIGQVLDPALGRDAQLFRDLLGRGAADSVDVGQRDFHALVGGDVDPGNTSHSLPFFSSTGLEDPPDPPPHLVARNPPQTKIRRAHECAAGDRLIGMGRR